jgi:hypothetical protein
VSRRSPAKGRDQRYFRGDVVERLNRLKDAGVIAGYQLPPRELGRLYVTEIAVRVPEAADPAFALMAVRETLRELPSFEELGGEIVLARSAGQAY